MGGGRKMGGIENRQHRLKKAILKIPIHVQFIFHKHESFGKSDSLNLIIGGLE